MTNVSPLSDSLTLPQFDLNTTTNNTTTFNILEGNISGTVNLSPLAAFLIVPELEEILELEPDTIPNSLTFSQDFQGGNFTVPNDPAHYEDGDIVLDFPSVGAVFGFTPTTPIETVLELFDIDITETVQDVLDALEITDAQDGVDLLDGLFNVTVTDDDNGSPETNNDFLTTGTGVTGFDFNYDNAQNALIIDGYNPDIVEGAFVGQAQIEASGNFSVNLVLSEFLEVIEAISEPLDYTLSPMMYNYISMYQFFYGDQLALASGSFNLDVTTDVASESLLSSTPLVAIPVG